jgi:hypothetical protein
MKVSELVKQLNEYDPNTELFVAYWTKNTVEEYGTSRVMTDEEWSSAVETLEDGEYYFQSATAEQIVQVAEEVMLETEE